nr:PREDICTED: uncharacterized protein LOC109039550 [Bemisia tabaci]XP_018910597.1 PREDICTED: uncharacterized protein LOC109039550 [Bemisia tabaci]
MQSLVSVGVIFAAISISCLYALSIRQAPGYGGYAPVGYAPVAPVYKKKPAQDLSKIPGTPGVDYPLYHTVPQTSFHCGNVPYAPGMYANVETGCQAYHVCHDGREGEQGASFLCTNGTLFNQREFACDWWYNVNCQEAPSLYALNADPAHNPFEPKKKAESAYVAPAPAYAPSPYAAPIAAYPSPAHHAYPAADY